VGAKNGSTPERLRLKTRLGEKEGEKKSKGK
jgi:hypothetical protein